MPPAGFELTIPASERPLIHALDRKATGIGINKFALDKIFLIICNRQDMKHLVSHSVHCKDF
jgi:hypothetical protein